MEASQPKPAPQQRQANCDKHGAYMSTNYFATRWSACDACVREARATAEAAEKAARHKEKLDKLIRHSGLEGRFLDATFENYAATTREQREVAQACREFAQTARNGDGGLWLIGPPGTGKTHLASAMVRHIIEERGFGAQIRSGREIIRMLRATWKVNGGNSSPFREGYTWDDWPTTEEGLIDEFGNAPLLVLDEIGVSFGTDAESVQMFDIIDMRYKLRRPTVVLSNLPATELKRTLGHRVYDRLREGAKLLTCQWPSHRGRPPAEPGLRAVK